MSQDWKKQFEEERQRRQKQRLEEDRARQEAEEARWERHAAIEFANFQRKYKCHICGKPSEDMRTYDWVVEDGNMVRDDFDQPYPGDLAMCQNCRRWTCYAHLYEGVCRRCWGK